MVIMKRSMLWKFMKQCASVHMYFLCYTVYLSHSNNKYIKGKSQTIRICYNGSTVRNNGSKLQMSSMESHKAHSNVKKKINFWSPSEKRGAKTQYKWECLLPKSRVLKCSRKWDAAVDTLPKICAKR